jgi:DNA polymerase III delta subunit
VTRAIVQEFTGLSREEQAWEIQGPVLEGKADAALIKLDELLRVSRVPEVMIGWSLVDLARKVHDAARLKAGGMPDPSIPGAIRHFGSDPGPLLRWAGRLGPARAGALLRAAVETDMRMKSGGAPEPSRAVEGLTAELATSAGTRGS